MTEFAFQIKHWSAWAPTMTSREAWQVWAKNPYLLPTEGMPNSAFIPAMLRRRCSKHTRAALSAAYLCLTHTERDSCRTVFCSRHGEVETMAQLLNSLAQDQPLSPAAFSLSVHNSAAGLFSINAKNKLFSTALSARKRGLTSGLLESLGLLWQEPQIPVLLLFVDETVPEIFANKSGNGALQDVQPYFSLGLFLESKNKKAPASTTVRLRIDRASSKEAMTATASPLDFIRWLLSSETTFTTYDRQLVFRLEKEESFASLLRGEADAVEKELPVSR